MALAESKCKSIVSAYRPCILRLAVLAVASSGWLSGCISRQAKPLVPELATPKGAVAPDSQQRQPIQRTIKLAAEGRGNNITVSVFNLLGKPITLGPKMFAVIVDGRAYPGNAKGVIAQFPIRTIRPEEGITGQFVYYRLGSLVGRRLVLKYPGVGVFSTTIQPTAAPPGSSTARPGTSP